MIDDTRQVGSDSWLTHKDFAQLANVNPAVASRILSNGRWRGIKLDVRSVKARGRGGRRLEVRFASLPLALQTKAASEIERHPNAAASNSGLSSTQRGTVWTIFDRLSERSKNVAAQRLNAVLATQTLIDAGTPKIKAYETVSRQIDQSVATLRGWISATKNVDRADWLAVLAPRWSGRTSTAECSPQAWDYFKADYLRLERPTAEACYERLIRAAEPYKWVVPSLDTLMRRIRREIDRPVLLLSREGAEALKRAYPPQERDRSVFHALEAVNGDGHRFDVFTSWPDGEITRPVMVAWQDIYSGLILSWRIDKTENKDVIRLSFGDVVEQYGIPSHAYLDNGRGFASKWMTGGTETRYRFKVRSEEPAGVLTQLGVKVHWTTPYHGQAKPIERAFRDFCERVSKHPAFSGAYTGNKPDAKPDNYSSRAIPIGKFADVLNQEIAAHNARSGRRGGVCRGRSFDEVFGESYQNAPIRKATAEQRRLWLLAAETSSSRQDGTITMSVDRRNRYWSPELSDHAGESLIVRFDPQALHEQIYVYSIDGRFICEAKCIQTAGFNDGLTAREFSRARNEWKRAARVQLNAERRMDAAEVASLLPPISHALIPEARVVGIVRPATRIEPPRPRELTPEERAIQQRIIDAQSESPKAVAVDSAEERYARAVTLEQQLSEGVALPADDLGWLRSYQETSEYRGQMNFRKAFG